jgi:hypothetical protein
MKSGWKTTEFWLAVLTAAGTAVGALSGLIPAELAVKITTIISAVYATLRTLAKSPEITTLVSK